MARLRLLAVVLGQIATVKNSAAENGATGSILPAAFADRHDDATADRDHQLSVAANQLEQAQQAVERARLEATEAKTALDEFVARHFDQPGATQSQQPVEPPRREAATRSDQAKAAANPEWDRLTRKFEELTTQRSELLERYTAVHPQVVELDGRLLALADELSSYVDQPGVELLPPSLPDAVLPSVEETRTAEQEGSEPAPQNKRREQVSHEYRVLLTRWQDAEHNLQLAVAGEIVARERLAALSAAPQLAPQPEAQPAERPALVLAAPPENRSQSVSAGGSQPLALAALLIALAVAALAAVRLAHSESIFSTIEEVAAALALPIVGVIPAREPNRRTHTPVVRVAIFAGELAVVFAAFAALAYAVQNAGTIWQFLSGSIGAER